MDLTYYNWYGYDLTNPKKIKKLTQKIERLVRLSPEYTTWANICRAGHDKCPICGELKEIMPLEVHHEPETLFDIVENTIREHAEEKEDILQLKPIDLVKEILDLHLQNKVKYKVICKSCHEKIHNMRKINEKVKSYEE